MLLVLEQGPEWSWIKGRFALELNGTLQNTYPVFMCKRETLRLALRW